MALTSDGKVYTWGLNDKGQLGKKIEISTAVPAQVILPKGKIVKVIANNNVTYAITNRGKVFAWGEGYLTNPKEIEFADDQENHLDIIDLSSTYTLSVEGNVYKKANKQKLEIGQKIKYISESQTHTVFLGANNNAFAIGTNTFGQFGNGTNVSNGTDIVEIKNRGR